MYNYKTTVRKIRIKSTKGRDYILVIGQEDRAYVSFLFSVMVTVDFDTKDIFLTLGI